MCFLLQFKKKKFIKNKTFLQKKILSEHSQYFAGVICYCIMVKRHYYYYDGIYPFFFFFFLFLVL